MGKGQHIFVRSFAGGIPIQHHGVDMGDGTVIHLASEDGGRWTISDSSGEFCVRRDSLDEFCEGREPRVMKHDDALEPDEIAERAESLLGQSGYSLLDGNCEHFATYCATGRYESRQIEMSEATVYSMASLATKAIWSISTRVGGRFATRAAVRMHPATMLADGVEIATLMVACNRGLKTEHSQRLASVSGTLAAAGVGALVGGPAGAAASVAAHTSSGVVADRICKAVRSFVK